MPSLQSFKRLILIPLFLFANGLFAEEIPVRESTTSFANPVTLSTERPGILAEVPKEGWRIKPDQLVIRLKDDVPLANLRLANARAESSIEIAIAQKAAASAAAEIRCGCRGESDLLFESRLSANPHDPTQVGRRGG